MAFVSIMRREAGRQLLSEVGRGIAFDSVPTRLRRSRGQHLRNGFGALLDAGSNVMFRPTRLAAVFQLTKKPVRANVRYGISQIVAAGAPRTERQRRALVAAAASVAVGVVLANRVRKRRAPSESPTEPTQHEPSPEPAVAGVAD